VSGFALLLALAQAPHLTAARAPQAPAIDGRLDDPVWQLATPSDAFTQKFPDEGRAPSEHTVVRVLYDDDAVYVGFECAQLRAPMVARLTRRDREIEADHVSIAIDTRRDGRSAFQFTVNAAGVLSDYLLFNDTDSSSDWDENWEARTARSASGWSAEFRIPLRILRFERLPVQDWGFQARRYISMRQETDEWAFIPRTAAGEVSHYGRLDNLRDLHPGSRLELRPFVVGKLRQRDPVTAMLAAGVDASGSAGLDLKWHATQGLTLDATFNPDFAQVEADQVILNLTNFEIEYPEKRPFFLEGIDTFATPLAVLYTRRIGHVPAAPALRSDPPYGEELYDTPDPATIYGAAKLSGRLTQRLSIGALSAVTGREDVQAQSAGGGARLSRVAEPLTIYNLLRLRRDAFGNGHVGLIASAVGRVEPTGDYPVVAPDPTATPTLLCPSGDTYPLTTPARPRCFHDAYVGGADARWRSPSGDYAASAQALATLIEHGPARTLRDGTVIGDGDADAGGIVTLSKEGGRWVGDVGYEGYGRKLDYNDLGFLARQNVHHLWLDTYYRTLEPRWKTLETQWGLELYGRQSLDGRKLARGYQVNSRGKLTNFWGWFLELHYREAHFDDREVGDGTALERDGLIGIELSMHTDPRRRVQLGLDSQTQFIFDGFHFEGDVVLTLRLLPQLDLELLPTLTYNAGEPRYLANAITAPGQYYFGKLSAQSVGTTLRATYTFTPRLTLQAYAQLFLAALHYSDFSTAQSDPMGPRPTVRLSDLRAAPPPMCPPATTCTDSEDGVLNVNLVLRWEYRLGSTLFLVYTRSQVPQLQLAQGQGASLDLGAIQRGPAANVLLLKLSYWWG